ncbi:BON domain-containing protein [Legionella sp. D16C41]|uniref:BON domain-containing protein n=1 Tax=Legionella sp. D16C41 TaxID=3402688 RepID=UPI003AF8F86C
MLKKGLFFSALALATTYPLLNFAASQANTSTNSSTQSTTTVTTPATNSSQGKTTSATSTSTNGQNAEINDAAITNQIKALYQKAPLVNNQAISITTTNHRVVLKGKVDTDMAYERAIALAESVEGVDDVDADNLLVKDSKSPIADTFTTARVKGTLMKEKLFGDKDIEYWPVSVETKNGVVYLAGNVDTQEQRNNIINIVKNVKGIKSVKSSLTVKDANNIKQNNNENNNTNISQ